MFAGQSATVDYTTLYDKLSANLLKDYQLFVCLRDGMIWPEGYPGPEANTAYEAAALKSFVNAGGGFYSLHKQQPRFGDFEGASRSAGWRVYRSPHAPAVQSARGRRVHGKGRVVFTSPGHTIHALWAPEYVKLQRRAVRSLLKDIS